MSDELEAKVRKFFEDKYNVLLVSLIVLTLILRIYHFWITKSQPVWWDEAEYLSMAKSIAFNVPFEWSAMRPPLMPILEAIIFMLGFTEPALRFILEVIPSVAVIYLVYYLGKEMYDKRIGLLAALITSFNYEIIFNTARLHTDIPSFFFILLAFIFFWKGYVKKEKAWYLWFAGLCVSLAFMIRILSLLVIFIFAIFVFSTDHLKPLKNKNIWIMSGVSFLAVLPYLIWAQIHFGSFMAFTTNTYANIASAAPLFWFALDFPKLFLGPVFFIFFIIGLLLFYKLILGIDLLFKGKEKTLITDYFLLLTILIPLAWFIFYLRGAEPRYAFIFVPAIGFIAARGILTIYDALKKYNKEIVILVVIGIVAYGCYANYQYGDALIKYKLDSYGQVKDAGLWLKANTNPGDSIYAASTTQLTYYSEKEINHFYVKNSSGQYVQDKDLLLKEMEKNNARYMVLSGFEPVFTPEFAFDIPSEMSDTWEPVQVYYIDAEKTQPILVIYKNIKIR